MITYNYSFILFTDKENKQHIIDNGGISLVINCLSRYKSRQCGTLLLPNTNSLYRFSMVNAWLSNVFILDFKSYVTCLLSTDMSHSKLYLTSLPPSKKKVKI